MKNRKDFKLLKLKIDEGLFASFSKVCYFSQSMWIERYNFVTSYKLPGILRWFEINKTSRV